MTVDQILSLGPALAEFLDEFANCFGRSAPRHHLRHSGRGQLSHLQRKRVEPLALCNPIAPRTLHEVRNTDVWDPPRARDRMPQLVARDQEDPKAIGILDDSGHPQSGQMPPGLQWPYCGRLGKTANGVVPVQRAFRSSDTRFRTMLATELFRPESWSNARERCRQAGRPDPSSGIRSQTDSKPGGTAVSPAGPSSAFWRTRKARWASRIAKSARIKR